MADQNGLKLIGWMLGGITAAVMLIAALLVHEAVANTGLQLESAAFAVQDDR